LLVRPSLRSSPAEELTKMMFVSLLGATTVQGLEGKRVGHADYIQNGAAPSPRSSRRSDGRLLYSNRRVPARFAWRKSNEFDNAGEPRRHEDTKEATKRKT
jgi:hypothetical protein